MIMANTVVIFLINMCPYSAKAAKPHSKRSLEIWNIECQLGMISDPDCPIDGGWSAWSSWSPCTGPCDGMGFKIRYRRCDNPPASKDGTPCSGETEETVSCHLTNCTADDYRLLASGNWPRMEAMKQLDTVPALMERCLQTDCPYEAIETALSNDNTWKINPEAVWNALHCVKQNIGCRVIGEWGVWGEWSACSARCGKGLRCRLRICDSPPPSDEINKCVGSPLEAQKCEGDQCAIEDHVVYNSGGAWGEWQPWSVCSETCGPGARRRRRVCEEKHTRPTAGTWGTHCQGPHDEIQICENWKCVLDGGWSGWGIWGPCSSTCGPGKRSRHRTCTRPIPAGGGAACVGPKTEVESCHINPCAVHSHVVAVLNGDSFIKYDFRNKRSTFIHLFVRFMPLSPYGVLVRQGDLANTRVRLSLQKWRVCVDATGLSTFCTLPSLCSPSAVEPAVWHNVLATVTNNEATLRLNDGQVSVRNTFPCNPDLANNDLPVLIGEKFRGEIQEVILNFIPLNLMQRDRARITDFFPVSVCNVVFEKGNIEEGFLNVDADHYVRLPCFKDLAEWRLELTIKPKRDTGTILFLRDSNYNSWLHLSLHNMRVKLQVGIEDFRTESSGTTDYFADEWLDIILSKQQYTSIIETSINAGERIYAVLEENVSVSPGKFKKCSIISLFKKKSPRKEVSKLLNNVPVILPICDDEFFVGNVPQEYKSLVEDSISFSGVVALIAVNGVMQDLHKLSLERSRRDGLQLSARTASVSGSYHEAAWGFSNRLNLTCLHTKLGLPPNTAHWLYLDTVISNVVSPKTARSVDDGRVLRLVTDTHKNQRLMRGFYTCRSHSKGLTLNLVTYAVLGKIPERLSSPDAITGVALLTTLVLIIGTLSWIILEAISDLRNGHGFFRDKHLSPDEEAEAVCDYIDKNVHLIGSENAEIAKARARRKGRELASKLNFAAQEPEGMMEEDKLSKLELKLPAIRSSEEIADEIYKCEPCYVSSPRHGSNITPRTMLSSSNDISPRVLCSRLLLSRGLRSRQKKKRLKNATNLLTIKSSTFVDQSPAHRILERFRKLKYED